MSQDEVKCSKCGKAIEEVIFIPIEERSPCPECGSRFRDRVVIFKDAIRIDDSGSRVTAKDEKGNLLFDHKEGRDLFKLTGKYNHLERRIDWRKNRYFEKIIDGETGEIIAYKDEPLSDHQGHGSAKNKKEV